MKCPKHSLLAEKLLRSDGKRLQKLEKRLDTHIYQCPICQQEFQQLNQKLVGAVPNAMDVLAAWQTEIEIQESREGWIEVPEGIPAVPNPVPLHRKIITQIEMAAETLFAPLRYAFKTHKGLVWKFAMLFLLLGGGAIFLFLQQRDESPSGSLPPVPGVSKGIPRGQREPHVNVRGIQPVGSVVGFEELAFEYRPDGGGIIHLPLPSDEPVTLMSEKDGFRLVMRLTQNYWLYAFLLDSTAHLDRLFPNAEFSSLTNPVKEGSISIPSDNRWFHLDKNTGKERIFIAVSQKRRKDWEKQYEQYHQSPEGSAQRQRVLDKLVKSWQAVAQNPTQELSGYVFEFNHEE